jgi:hypothetical protein
LPLGRLTRAPQAPSGRRRIAPSLCPRRVVAIPARAARSRRPSRSPRRRCSPALTRSRRCLARRKTALFPGRRRRQPPRTPRSRPAPSPACRGEPGSLRCAAPCAPSRPGGPSTVPPPSARPAPAPSAGAPPELPSGPAGSARRGRPSDRPASGCSARPRWTRLAAGTRSPGVPPARPGRAGRAVVPRPARPRREPHELRSRGGRREGGAQRRRPAGRRRGAPGRGRLPPGPPPCSACG